MRKCLTSLWPMRMWRNWTIWPLLRLWRCEIFELLSVNVKCRAANVYKSFNWWWWSWGARYLNCWCKCNTYIHTCRPWRRYTFKYIHTHMQALKALYIHIQTYTHAGLEGALHSHTYMHTCRPLRRYKFTCIHTHTCRPWRRSKFTYAVKINLQWQWPWHTYIHTCRPSRRCTSSAWCVTRRLLALRRPRPLSRLISQ